MNDCRICLKCEGEKDIFQLDAEKQGDSKSFLEIMLFCLDIIVPRDSTFGTKLCLKCYKKILAFQKFKAIALKNDAYLRTVDILNVGIKNEVFLIDDIKCDEKYSDNDLSNNNLEDDIKEEVKQEEQYEFIQSDDEVLSVIKQIKYENTSEKSKENDPIKRKVYIKKERKRSKENEKRDQVCDECGKSVRNLKDHMIRHRSINERKCIKCKLCDKYFSSYSARYRHHKVKHLGIKQHCDICNKDVSSLRAHRLVVHNTEDLRYECVTCGRRFISQSTLDMHITIHTKDRPHACDQCDKKFRNKITMIQHKRQVHDKERSHLCQFCSKSFFKKYHLQIHLRSHTNEKPYQCSDCQKCFSTRTTLKNHQLIHNDVKMFGCTVCDMTFSKPGYLRNHMISHTKEKRHSCKYCGVRFGRSDHRKRHEFTAHERNHGLLKI